jgi:hypothetical protein
MICTQCQRENLPDAIFAITAVCGSKLFVLTVVNRTVMEPAFAGFALKP